MRHFRYSIVDFIVGLINIFFSIAILGLAIRFVLRLFGANPESGFVQFVYRSTQPLLYPFRNIFETIVVDPGNVLELTTLLVIVIYAIIAWILTMFVTMFDTYSTDWRSRYTRP